jgi:hypothetical protein
LGEGRDSERLLKFMESLWPQGGVSTSGGEGEAGGAAHILKSTLYSDL